MWIIELLLFLGIFVPIAFAVAALGNIDWGKRGGL